MTSRVLGIARETVLAAMFGAGATMDAFNVAFRVPNLLRDLFAEGAMTAAFVPTFTRALHLVRVGEVVRTVFSAETIGRLGLDSAVVVVRREPGLGTRVSLLREFLADPSLGARAARVWIEGLPDSPSMAPSLLDELRRSS